MAINTPATNEEEESFYSKLGVSLTSLKGAHQAIKLNRHTGNVLCLVGEAGIGKTQIIKQIAAQRRPKSPFTWRNQRWETGVPVKVMYLAHIQAEDMGVPYPSRAKRNELLSECDLFLRIAEHAKSTRYSNLCQHAFDHAMKIATTVLDSGSPLDDGTFEFLIERNLKDLPPEGILFLDEWNRADKSVIKSFFTLLEDREIHGIPLVPPGVQIVAAMNPSDGAYSVNEAEKDHAFRRRLSFIAVAVNTGGFLEYAKTCFHPLVVSYLTALPTQIYDTKIRNSGRVFPCPANWEKVSHVLKAAEAEKTDFTTQGVELTVGGHIGAHITMQFMDYIRDQQTVINPQEVLDKYTERSNVRKRVTHLVESNRIDILGELSQAVAVQLFVQKQSAELIAARLGLFLSDLKPEMAINFIVHQLHASGRDRTDLAYLDEISVALTKEQVYRDLFQEIADAMRKARAETESSSPLPI